MERVKEEFKRFKELNLSIDDNIGWYIRQYNDTFNFLRLDGFKNPLINDRNCETCFFEACIEREVVPFEIAENLYHFMNALEHYKTIDNIFEFKDYRNTYLKAYQDVIDIIVIRFSYLN